MDKELSTDNYEGHKNRRLFMDKELSPDNYDRQKSRLKGDVFYGK